eukprot:3623059-Prymnesium_polylepis.1
MQHSVVAGAVEEEELLAEHRLVADAGRGDANLREVHEAQARGGTRFLDEPTKLVLLGIRRQRL